MARGSERHVARKLPFTDLLITSISCFLSAPGTASTSPRGSKVKMPHEDQGLVCYSTLTTVHLVLELNMTRPNRNKHNTCKMTRPTSEARQINTETQSSVKPSWFRTREAVLRFGSFCYLFSWNARCPRPARSVKPWLIDTNVNAGCIRSPDMAEKVDGERRRRICVLEYTRKSTQNSGVFAPACCGSFSIQMISKQGRTCQCISVFTSAVFHVLT